MNVIVNVKFQHICEEMHFAGIYSVDSAGAATVLRMNIEGSLKDHFNCAVLNLILFLQCYFADFHPASLRVSPDRAQHFSSESVSLSCEGKSAEWRMMRFTKSDHLSNCSDFGMVKRSTCNVHNFNNNTAVYWCESGSGQFSNAVNITAQSKYILGDHV